MSYIELLLQKLMSINIFNILLLFYFNFSPPYYLNEETNETTYDDPRAMHDVYIIFFIYYIFYSGLKHLHIPMMKMIRKT